MTNKTLNNFDNLPFDTEKLDNVIKITPKVPKNLSKKNREKFNKKKVTVNFILFDPEDLENLRKIKIEKPIESFFSKVVKKLSRA